jgi:hypothetical protein
MSSRHRFRARAQHFDRPGETLAMQQGLDVLLNIRAVTMSSQEMQKLPQRHHGFVWLPNQAHIEMKAMEFRSPAGPSAFQITREQDRILANQMRMATHQRGGLLTGQDEQRVMVLKPGDHVEILANHPR